MRLSEEQDQWLETMVHTALTARLSNHVFLSMAYEHVGWPSVV